MKKDIDCSCYNGATFGWTGTDLTGAVKSGTSYSFTYNDEGIRTSKTKNGVTTTYYLSGSHLVAEETSGNLTVYIYDAEGLPLGMRYHGAAYAEDVWDAYWYEKNIFGDVVAVYNSAGTKLISYKYDAFGKATRSYHNSGGSTTATKNPFRYRGYYYDQDLQLYYLNSIYYDGYTGRFISPASALNVTFGSLDGLNLYVYANNNPISVAYSSSGVAYSSSGVGFDVISSLSLGGLSSIGNILGYTNSFNVFAGLNWPQLNAKNLVKDTFISLGEVGSRVAWGLTKNGRAFLDFHYSAYGINGYTALDNLSSTSSKIFKGIGIGLMALDVLEAGYYSYKNGQSFGQGALNIGLTAGKNILVYKASTGVATAVGTWAGAKLGAYLGSAAGPVGFAIGAVAGAAVGWGIDEFGEVIIDWVVGWFD